MKTQLLILVAGLISFNAQAAIKAETVLYKEGNVSLEGYIAYDDSVKKERPGIVIVHDWMGPSAFTEGRAKELAKLGYVAFAADIYGKGVRPANAEEAGKLAGHFKGDRGLLRARTKAAMDQLLSTKLVDSKKVVVMGYCFGGTAALELARSGAPLAGTASFHGGLSTPNASDAKNIHGKVLVMHGAIDPYVPQAEVIAFKEEMSKARVDWKFISYANAVHAFAVPGAGNDPSKGAAYNAAADKKSWADFQKFLNDLFK